MSNVYQKLQQARVDLQNMKLKKTGKNRTFTYYELGDFLPAINSVCQKHDLFTHFNIITDKGIEKAVLTVYNASEPQEKVSFISPTAEAALPGGGQKIQELGSKLTYLRRYMHYTAFEVAESDIVDLINRDLTDDVSEDDIKLIQNCKTSKGLTALYTELSKKYKMTLIQPMFEEAKEKLNQKESKA